MEDQAGVIVALGELGGGAVGRDPVNELNTLCVFPFTLDIEGDPSFVTLAIGDRPPVDLSRADLGRAGALDFVLW